MNKIVCFVVVVSLMAPVSAWAEKKDKLLTGGIFAIGSVYLFDQSATYGRRAVSSGSAIQERKARKLEFFALASAFTSTALFTSYAIDVRFDRERLAVSIGKRF